MPSSPPQDPIADFLAQGTPLVLDGALATELERRGADLRDPLWSAKLLIEQPDLIRAVHLNYFEAGADVATTATYQASFEGFAGRGIGEAAAAQLMLDAVLLAVDARAQFWSEPRNRANRRRPLVAASVGPYGAMRADGSEYRGHYGIGTAELAQFHRRRLQVLARSAADLLACETLPSLDEAVVLATLLRDFPGRSAWISFSCRDALHTCEGQPIGECVRRLNDFEQVAAVGVNCSKPEFMAPLLQEMRQHTDKPLLVYPNSGEHYDAVHKRWQGPPDAAGFGDAAAAWRASGASLIGGCCRTSPADIRAVKSRLRAAVLHGDVR
jgi:homocysteine S-methyltransferase